MKLIISLFVFLTAFYQTIKAQTTKFNAPIVDDQVIFEEKDGLVAVEAEYFYQQSKSEIREWYRTSKNESPAVGRDDDPPPCKEDLMIIE